MADGDIVANFMVITGADDGVAIQMLEAANFSLEDAVNLFFAAEGHASGGRGGGGGGSAAGDAAGGGSRASRGQATGPTHGVDEEQVRAPLPTKVERLYGDDYDSRMYPSTHQYHGLSGRPTPAQQLDVFRDFRAESAAAAAGGAGQASRGAGTGDAGGGIQGLSGLFKLPPDLVFCGNAEAAKARAVTEGKWLLLNVQSATEFASHRLNRDTWSHEALKEVLKGTFVFYQTHENSPDGRALVKAYRLDPLSGGSGSLPAILVVDPMTGAQLWQTTGFIDAEKLMEELVPFMDHGPTDPGAASLAQANLKRKTSATAMAGSIATAATVATGGPGASRGPMTEDEEMALAIAMSMEREGQGGGVAVGGSDATALDADAGGDALDDLDEAAIWEHIQAAERQQAQAAAGASQKKSPEEFAAEARARVPPEPAEGDPDAVRVALRMPDGTRVARRFRRTDHVRVLLDLGLASVPEAAAGRSLVISHAMPGGQVLSDPDQTLEAAGVAGAMLAVKLGE